MLLSGTPGTSLMRVHMIAALSARHRTYALDNVNDVGMSVPRREDWPAEALVDWLDEVFRVLVPDGPLRMVWPTVLDDERGDGGACHACSRSVSTRGSTRRRPR